MRVSPRNALLIAAAALVFLVIAFELARFLTAASNERDRVFGVLVAQVKGDGAGVARRLDGCDGSCRKQLARTVGREKRPGAPKILSYNSPTAYDLKSHATANVRVAWSIPAVNGLPVVQCVTVTRKWSFISGASVSLRRLSAPIGNQASCPKP